MKKILFLAIIILLSITLVYAEEKCTVISGTGKNLGDEIACGSEHFYVLSSDKDQTRMLAKYNLYTGYTIERVPIENNTSTISDYCSAKAMEMGGTNKVYNADSLMLPEGIFPDLYCYIEIPITAEKILQSEEAIGAHVDSEGNYLYPQVGDNYIDVGSNQSDSKVPDSNVTYSDPNFSDYIIQFDDTTVSGIKLSGYKTSLEEMGFTIDNIDFLSVSEIEKIIKEKTNKTLPLAEWGNAVSSIPREGAPVVEGVFGNLKDYVPNEYKWLYSTTYWNKTTFTASNTYYGKYNMFVGSMGKLCGAGTAHCMYKTTIGCGIRPVVTISNKLVESKIDENNSEKPEEPTKKEEPKQEKNPDTKDVTIYLLIILAFISSLIVIISKVKMVNRRV